MNLHQWFQRLAGPRPQPCAQSAVSAPGDSAAVERGINQNIDDSPIRSGPSNDTFLLSISREAMACEFEVLLNQHQYATGAELAADALEIVGQLESLLSVYRPRSELSILNRFGSLRPSPLSADTLTLLELAVDIHKLTGGAFDITAGSLSDVWGFSRRSGAIPSADELQAALAKVGTQHLQLDAVAQTARLLVDGVQVNPGGIGKGYALDRAVGKMVAAGIGDFMMHGGLSSVVARGSRRQDSSGGGWLVALKHPWRWEETLGTIRLQDQALGTSGSGKQFFHFGGKRYSHIIDPRTGWPAEGMMSVTVVCRSGAVADALATALFVLGPELSRRFCEQHPEVSAILIYLNPSGRQTIDVLNFLENAWLPA